MMKKIYFTIAGTKYYHGSDFMQPGMQVHLIKEPDNRCDREAIRVEMDGLGKIGYVANSCRTVIGESFSAGRMYDRIGDTAEGEILYVLEDGVLCSVDEGSVIYELWQKIIVEETVEETAEETVD